jgi:hypothetical protein
MAEINATISSERQFHYNWHFLWPMYTWYYESQIVSKYLRYLRSTICLHDEILECSPHTTTPFEGSVKQFLQVFNHDVCALLEMYAKPRYHEGNRHISSCGMGVLHNVRRDHRSSIAVAPKYESSVCRPERPWQHNCGAQDIHALGARGRCYLVNGTSTAREDHHSFAVPFQELS